MAIHHMREKGYPQLPGYNWRPIQESDAPALAQLERQCAALDGSVGLRSHQEWSRHLQDHERLLENSLAAASEDGQVIAYAYIEYTHEGDELIAHLDGRVHPAFRGQAVGTQLMTWLETTARRHLEKFAGKRRKVLHNSFRDRSPDAMRLATLHGYQLQSEADLLHIALPASICGPEVTGEMQIESYSLRNSGEYFELYQKTFHGLPGGGLSLDAWLYFYINSELRLLNPSLSLLMRIGAQAHAFSLCHSLPDQESGEFFITQLGLLPAIIGSETVDTFVLHCLRAIHRKGFRTVQVPVENINFDLGAVLDRHSIPHRKTYQEYRKILP